MKQPEDKKTLDFLDEQKRGRGRPPVANALTPADRAKRYRDKKRQSKGNNSVTRHEKSDSESVGMLESRIMLLNAENGLLGKELEDAKARIADLTGALEVVVKLRSAKKGIPADVLDALSKLLISSRPKRKQSKL